MNVKLSNAQKIKILNSDDIYPRSPRYGIKNKNNAAGVDMKGVSVIAYPALVKLSSDIWGRYVILLLTFRHRKQQKKKCLLAHLEIHFALKRIFVQI
jgi:hypothetical protein